MPIVVKKAILNRRCKESRFQLLQVFQIEVLVSKANLDLTAPVPCQEYIKYKYVNQIYNEKGIGSVHCHISSSS